MAGWFTDIASLVTAIGDFQAQMLARLDTIIALLRELVNKK